MLAILLIRLVVTCSSTFQVKEKADDCSESVSHSMLGPTGNVFLERLLFALPSPGLQTGSKQQCRERCKVAVLLSETLEWPCVATDH